MKCDALLRGAEQSVCVKEAGVGVDEGQGQDDEDICLQGMGMSVDRGQA